VGEIVTIAENPMDWNDYSSHNNFINGTAKLEQGLFILAKRQPLTASIRTTTQLQFHMKSVW
jgi:hypothetical protein